LRPKRPLNFPLARRFALRFNARRNPLQSVLDLNLAHDDLLTLIVVTVTDHGAIMPDAVSDDVDMLVLGVNVLDDTVLALV